MILTYKGLNFVADKCGTYFRVHGCLETGVAHNVLIAFSEVDPNNQIEDISNLSKENKYFLQHGSVMPNHVPEQPEGIMEQLFDGQDTSDTTNDSEESTTPVEGEERDQGSV